MGRRKQNDRGEYIINNPSLNEGRTSFDIQRTEQQLREQTQAGIDNLRSSTIDSSLSATGTRSDLYLQHKGIEYEHDMHNLINFLSVIDKLLQEIEDTESGITTRGVQSSGKKTMKEAKAKLKQYKKQLKAKKKALLKQDRAEIFDSDISHVRDLWQQINKVRSDVGLGQWGEFSSTASFLYNSPENARTANRHQEQAAEFEQKLLAEVRQGAILSIFNGNTQNAINFLRRIAEGRYDQADYTFYINNASILNPCLQRCGINPPIAISNNPSASREGLSNSPRSIDYSNQNWGETFQQGGIAGCLDRVLSNFGNMSQGQRDTWKSLGVLSIVGAGIFGLYKFYTNKNMGFWAKAGITAGTIFGSQVLTGENPIAIFNKILTGGISFDDLGEKFGNTISGLGSSNSPSSENTDGYNQGSYEVQETVVPAMYSMMIFNANTKVSDIRNMTELFKDNENWKLFYNESCTKLQNKYGQQAMESFRSIFSDQYDEQKWKNRLASFGVTDSTNANESVYGLANNASMNQTILQKFKEDNGLKDTNNDSFKAYVASKKSNNQPIDIDDLNAHINERFTVDVKATNTNRPEDEQNREKLKQQVNLLSLDNDKKAELTQAIQDFYNQRSIESKPKLNDFVLNANGSILIVKSQNGNKTEIDLSSNSLKSNNTQINFPSLSEALNAADLSNYILSLTNKQNPINLPPFQYQPGQKAICFNNATTFSFNLDTRILSINRFKDRSTIDRNAKEYANYLSDHRKDINKLSLNNYPLVASLGLDFYSNEDEVQRLEAYLQNVKNKLQYSVKDDTDKPFGTKIFNNHLRFKATSGAIEEFPENILKEFPTLSRNGYEDAFLNALNDPNNKMRGSATS